MSSAEARLRVMAPTHRRDWQWQLLGEFLRELELGRGHALEIGLLQALTRLPNLDVPSLRGALAEFFGLDLAALTASPGVRYSEPLGCSESSPGFGVPRPRASCAYYWGSPC